MYIPLSSFGERERSRRQAASVFFPMKTSIYVDGFNLYYGAVRSTPSKIDVQDLVG